MTYVRWKEDLERRVSYIESAIAQTPSDARIISSSISNDEVRTSLLTNDLGPHSIQVPITEPDRGSLNLSLSLGAFPGSSMSNILSPNILNERTPRSDLIYDNKISLEDAKQYFALYKRQLDPYIHHVLGENDTMSIIRERSPILLNAICTVAALRSGSKDYQDCLQAFVNRVSHVVFQTEYEFDDVRALCIGAFWLSDISSALNGLGECNVHKLSRYKLTNLKAVRISTQLDLHRCISKMPHTKRACYDRTRLYFLVYLCDHHCSIIYGRPPMTMELGSLKRPRVFLQSKFSSRPDFNLIGEVEYWSINRRIFQLFGADVESPILDEKVIRLQELNSALDTWHQWSHELLALLGGAEDGSQRTLDFYLHSAKLYLFSHVFRGLSSTAQNVTANPTIDPANTAAKSALSVLRCAVETDHDISRLEDLPVFFATMIAFASVCLIRTFLEKGNLDDGRQAELLRYFNRIIQGVRSFSSPNTSKHPLRDIANSLESATRGRNQLSEAQSIETGADALLDLDFNFDIFANDPTSLSFPGSEDWWMFYPEQTEILSL